MLKDGEHSENEREVYGFCMHVTDHQQGDGDGRGGSK